MKYFIKILFVVGLLSSLSPASWADRIKDLTTGDVEFSAYFNASAAINNSHAKTSEILRHA